MSDQDSSENTPPAKSGAEKVIPGDAHIDRFYDAEHEVLVATGNFSALNEAYLSHVRRWAEIPEPLFCLMMQQALAGAALYLSCRPIDETVGWTFSIQKPLLSLFVTGDADANYVNGRVITDGVKQFESSRLYVRSQRTGKEPSQSVVDVSGLDILLMFEDYYSRSEQSHARFFEYEGGKYTMIVSLPGVDLPWLKSLDRDSAQKWLDESQLKVIDDRNFRFHCECDPEKMKSVIRTIYENNFDELFEGEEMVEVMCPSCGHQWNLSRGDLDD